MWGRVWFDILINSTEKREATAVIGRKADVTQVSGEGGVCYFVAPNDDEGISCVFCRFTVVERPCTMLMFCETAHVQQENSMACRASPAPSSTEA